MMISMKKDEKVEYNKKKGINVYRVQNEYLEVWGL